MRKLSNTPEDLAYLSGLLVEQTTVKANFTIGVFTSILADGLEILDVLGEITDLNTETGECEWKDSEGRQMFSVSVNCVTLI